MNSKHYSNRVVQFVKTLENNHKLTLKLLIRQFVSADNRTEDLDFKNVLFAILNSQLFTSGNMSTKI